MQWARALASPLLAEGHDWGWHGGGQSRQLTSNRTLLITQDMEDETDTESDEGADARTDLLSSTHSVRLG